MTSDREVVARALVEIPWSECHPQQAEYWLGKADAVLAALGLSDGRQWRDIARAPKDGSDALVWSKGHLVMMARWAGHSMVGGPSWWSNGVPIIPQPTLWQPVPEAPRNV